MVGQHPMKSVRAIFHLQCDDADGRSSVSERWITKVVSKTNMLVRIHPQQWWTVNIMVLTKQLNDDRSEMLMFSNHDLCISFVFV